VPSNRDQLAQAQTDTATALVSVYQALGGAGLRPLHNNFAACMATPAASRCAARVV